MDKNLMTDNLSLWNIAYYVIGNAQLSVAMFGAYSYTNMATWCQIRLLNVDSLSPFLACSAQTSWVLVWQLGTFSCAIFVYADVALKQTVIIVVHSLKVVQMVSKSQQSRYIMPPISKYAFQIIILNSLNFVSKSFQHPVSFSSKAKCNTSVVIGLSFLITHIGPRRIPQTTPYTCI